MDRLFCLTIGGPDFETFGVFIFIGIRMYLV
jgi:hypothetical protein